MHHADRARTDLPEQLMKAGVVHLVGQEGDVELRILRRRWHAAGRAAAAATIFVGRLRPHPHNYVAPIHLGPSPPSHITHEFGHEQRPSIPS